MPLEELDRAFPRIRLRNGIHLPTYHRFHERKKVLTVHHMQPKDKTEIQIAEPTEDTPEEGLGETLRENQDQVTEEGQPIHENYDQTEAKTIQQIQSIWANPKP